MNATKTMLKAIVLTQLMQSVQDQGRAPTEDEIVAVEGFNIALQAAETGGLLDRNIDEVYTDLLAAIESIPEAA
jgi:hypothetical protein